MDRQAEHARKLVEEVLQEIEKGNIAGSGIETDIIKVDGILQYGNKLVYSFIVNTSDVQQEERMSEDAEKQ